MNQKGFTMMELIIVIVIIVIMASMIIPKATKYAEHKKEKELSNYTEILKKAVRQYYALEGKYPEVDAKTGAPNLDGYKVIIDSKYIYTYDKDNPDDLKVGYKP